MGLKSTGREIREGLRAGEMELAERYGSCECLPVCARLRLHQGVCIREREEREEREREGQQ